MPDTLGRSGLVASYAVLRCRTKPYTKSPTFPLFINRERLSGPKIDVRSFEHRGFDLPSRTISHHLPIEETKLRGNASSAVEALRCNHKVPVGAPCYLDH